MTATKIDRKKGISKFEIRKLCREYAEKYTNIQRDEFKRLGVFGDWDEPYLTMSNIYESVIVRELGKFVEKGSIYKRKKPVLWCISCETALAEAEVEYSENVAGIPIHTLPYQHLLLSTHDYTGFAVLHEGFKEAGQPGGQWDEALTEYCSGRRKNPVWVIGESDYEDRRGTPIDTVKNIFLLKNVTRPAAMEALRCGRLYVVTGGLSLDNFKIAREEYPKIEISVSIAGNNKKEAYIRLIKNGRVFKAFKEKLPFQTAVVDEEPAGGKAYYRLDVSCEGSRLISNPLFSE